MNHARFRLLGLLLLSLRAGEWLLRRKWGVI